MNRTTFIQGADILATAWALAALLAAFAFQYIGGLEPCVLCVWQRIPLAFAVALGAGALFVPAARYRWFLIGFSGLAVLVSGGLGGYHVGVEQNWWQMTCTGSGGIDPDRMREILQDFGKGTFEPAPACDEVAWSLLGLSMAAWNAIGSGIVGATAIGLATRNFLRS